MNVFTSLDQLVGRTPLLEIQNYRRMRGLDAAIYVKLEYLNPAGSAKDRVARQMIAEAEKSRRLTPGAVIIEPTSGNTGIGLAAMGVSRGYRVILTMPDSMSAERRTLLKAYGAELVLTPGELGMAGAIEKAEELHAQIPGSIIAGQFDNPANPLAHYLTTGPEIWDDTDGAVDIFVAGMGTGGTVSGTARYLKEQNPAVQVVAIEPASSPLLTKGYTGSHGLQGIGANFVPKNYDASLIDEVIAVAEEDAYRTGRLLARSEGILAGITSGAALYAAETIAKRPENRGKHIVVLLPDTGDRYLSTPLFQEG